MADRLLVAAGAAFALLLLVVALAAPPNSWDSMTYHLSRVMHWVQQGSLAHFPTQNLREIEFGPWAELAILHLFLLTGGDRLSNLPQWSAMALSVVAVAGLARRFGGDRTASVVAGLFCLSIPMGVVQATGTQNDYMVALWLVALVVLAGATEGKAPGEMGEKRLGGYLAWGCALGLALLTKGTAYAYAAPFVVWFGWRAVRAQGRKAWRGLALASLAVVALNAGHWARNLDYSGNPLGRLTPLHGMGTSGPRLIASNVLRGLAVHANVGWVDVRAPTWRGLAAIHHWLGIDLYDRDTTFPWTRPFDDLRRPYHDSQAGNGLHLVTIAVVFLALLLGRIGGRARGEMVTQAALVAAAFLLLCATIRWQFWISRLQLPLFVLASPVVGVWLAARWRWAARSTAVALLVLALPVLLYANARPLLTERSVLRAPRWEQMFQHLPELAPRYHELVERIRASGCRRVGLVLIGDDAEYPLWIALGDQVRFEHVHVWVENPSAALVERPGWKPFAPCLVVSLGRANLGIIDAPPAPGLG